MIDNDLHIPSSILLKLRSAQHVVVFTGAGISAESGVPTFRDAQTGLWAKYEPTELATPESFAKQPELVWDWYAWRRTLINQVEPNLAHYAVADLAEKVKKLTVITQNVDGLHQRAGSEHILEVHGNIHRVRCQQNSHFIENWQDLPGKPPACPHCQSLLRPDVVWFGESLPQDILRAAVKAAHDCDFFFSIGTSALVQPAASIPLEALRYQATGVEINPTSTPMSTAMTYSLLGKAGEFLPAILRQAWQI